MATTIYKSNIVKYRLVKEPVDIKKIKVKSSEDIEKFARELWQEIDIVESFYAFYLNRSNNIVGYRLISTGGLNSAIVDTTLLVKYAIESLSSGVIVAHNHPSGQLNPSKNDQNITQKIKSGLNLFDIKLLDHVILIPDNNEPYINNYLSFADEGLL